MGRALVVVNPWARRGSAVRRYDRIRSEVTAGFDARHVLMDASGDWVRAVARAHRDGFDRVVAVGGDGTVHAIANALLRDDVSTARRVTLAAVGLGSSNDFHKPVRTRVRGVPIRFGAPVGRDVGLATWEDAVGNPHARWFIVSASVGLTARANRRFSCARGLEARLGARSVGAAIAVAAMAALARHENVRARLRPTMQAPTREVAVSNLGVMLTPHLAGPLRYGGAIEPGDGQFALHLCAGMATLGLLRAMGELSCGRFRRSPGTESWSSRALGVEFDGEDDLELDGEIFRAHKVHFEAFAGALAVCT